jgi:hypothetical protein
MDQGPIETAYERYSDAMSAGDLAGLEGATTRRYFQELKNDCAAQGTGDDALSQMLQEMAQMSPPLSLIENREVLVNGPRAAIWGWADDPDDGCMAMYVRFVDEGSGPVYDDAFFYQSDSQPNGMTFEMLSEHLPEEFALEVDRAVPEAVEPIEIVEADVAALGAAYERLRQAMIEGDMKGFETASTKRFFVDLLNDGLKAGLSEEDMAQKLPDIIGSKPPLDAVESHAVIQKGTDSALWGWVENPTQKGMCRVMFIKFVDEGEGPKFDDIFLHQEEGLMDGVTEEIVLSRIPFELQIGMSRTVPERYEPPSTVHMDVAAIGWDLKIVVNGSSSSFVGGTRKSEEVDSGIKKGQNTIAIEATKRSGDEDDAEVVIRVTPPGGDGAHEAFRWKPESHEPATVDGSFEV